ncbi:hypothetical protein RvY_18940 [Ramazzottius varieornatus]|uniref:Granulins domain-containing protein n=1 Tax=Ramazzottius varieornatus TaxID=947166 RepID=A0A1D1W7L4_RAMVA|nr:hypothetical protein RvY_18940 [Ramazzottius varieornatus]
MLHSVFIATLLGAAGWVSAVLLPGGRSTGSFLPWSSLNERVAYNVSTAVFCPDHKECPESSTCCVMKNAAYGCCPFPEADCCSDGLHCCPHGSKCDMEQKRCASTANHIPLAKKFLWTKTLQSVGLKTITCGDKQSECPDSSTCCQLASGNWGCCPFPNALCCSDKEHCCPHGTKCDLEQKRCAAEDTHALTKPLQPIYGASGSAKKTFKGFGDNICPDGNRTCAADNTCCQLKNGRYSCCAFKNAVCCGDGEHCCPEGFECHPERGECEAQKRRKALVKSLPTVGAESETRLVLLSDTICPGRNRTCAGDFSCCQTNAGDYSCCAFKNAVCCADGEHCCPQDYQCHPERGECELQKKRKMHRG